jgi:hypothetical protein
MPEQKNVSKKSQTFILNQDAPRFATRVLATINKESMIFSFGVENPFNLNEIQVHTRIALPINTYRAFKTMLDKISSDIELNRAMQGIRYDQIPSDS